LFFVVNQVINYPGQTRIVVQIMADTIYGARHALETLGQLVSMKPGSENQ
jgi:hypothetical protein